MSDRASIRRADSIASGDMYSGDPTTDCERVNETSDAVLVRDQAALPNR
jgi:hypothetical protein